MGKKSIAIFEGNSLLDTLQAVGLMMGQAKVKFVGRYFLGKEKVAAVVKGSTEEISSGVNFVQRELGRSSLLIGVLNEVPKNVLDVMLAPHKGFHPVCTVKEPALVERFQENDKIGSMVDPEDATTTPVPVPARSLEGDTSLSKKRKLRLGIVLEHFSKNRNRKITANDILKALPDFSKPTLGRDLDYLSKNGLIEKRSKGRGTFYIARH